MGPNFSRASIRSASTTASQRPRTCTTGLGEIRWESPSLSCNTHKLRSHTALGSSGMKPPMTPTPPVYRRQQIDLRVKEQPDGRFFRSNSCEPLAHSSQSLAGKPSNYPDGNHRPTPNLPFTSKGLEKVLEKILEKVLELVVNPKQPKHQTGNIFRFNLLRQEVRVKQTRVTLGDLNGGSTTRLQRRRRGETR